MDYSNKYIETIYKKAMITRSQLEKDMQKRSQEEMDKRFWEFLGARMQRLLEQASGLFQMGGLSKQQIDNAEKELSDFFTMVIMNTMPEVINQLTMDLTKEKMLIKIKSEN